MATTPAWFNKDQYLASKLAQLRAEGETQYETVEEVEAALEAAGFDAFDHFQEYGLIERTSPNEYFNATEYLNAQVIYLNERDGVDTWTADSVSDAIAAAGMTLWEHFATYGWQEGVNPSNKFDTNKYLESKLAQLQATEPDAEWTLEKLVDALAEAGLDPVSHYVEFGANEEGVEVSPAENPVPSDGRTPFTLTDAIEEYLAAQDALNEFLVDALENEYVEEAADGEDVATPEDLEAALEAVEGNLDFFVPGFSEEDSERVREAKLADAIDNVKKEIAAAEKALAAAQKDFLAEASSAEKKLAAQYEARAAALEAAKQARDDAEDDAEEALEAFVAAQEKNGVEILVSDDLQTIARAVEDAEPVVLAQFQPFEDGEIEGGRYVITADGLGVAGLQALVDVINQALEASDAVNEARADRDEARADLGIIITNEGETVSVEFVDVEETGATAEVAALYYQVIGLSEALEEGQAYQQGLEATIADYRELVELNEQYEELAGAVEDARAAIENDADADPAGFGITLLESDATTFTANNDVYIFDEDALEEAGATALANFGRSGEDKIFFGEGYTFVALGDDDISGNVGDLNALEIFWAEDATGVTLYVETETFAGNASGTNDLIEITLTGVQAADITDDLIEGYLTAGTAI